MHPGFHHGTIHSLSGVDLAETVPRWKVTASLFKMSLVLLMYGKGERRVVPLFLVTESRPRVDTNTTWSVVGAHE